jgi:hypothetical protein
MNTARKPYAPPTVTPLAPTAARARTLAAILGLEGNGLMVLTCIECGHHTAGLPPARCWRCYPRAPQLVALVATVRARRGLP